jgi:hypothetical protein
MRPAFFANISFPVAPFHLPAQLGMADMGVRRDKAALSSGCEARRGDIGIADHIGERLQRVAPGGSNAATRTARVAHSPASERGAVDRTYSGRSPEAPFPGSTMNNSR